jgi:hypothetical protein
LTQPCSCQGFFSAHICLSVYLSFIS